MICHPINCVFKIFLHKPSKRVAIEFNVVCTQKHQGVGAVEFISRKQTCCCWSHCTLTCTTADGVGNTVWLLVTVIAQQYPLVYIYIYKETLGLLMVLLLEYVEIFFRICWVLIEFS